jgi:hypothetical protein
MSTSEERVADNKRRSPHCSPRPQRARGSPRLVRQIERSTVPNSVTTPNQTLSQVSHTVLVTEPPNSQSVYMIHREPFSSCTYNSCFGLSHKTLHTCHGFLSFKSPFTFRPFGKQILLIKDVYGVFQGIVLWNSRTHKKHVTTCSFKVDKSCGFNEHIYTSLHVDLMLGCVCIA